MLLIHKMEKTHFSPSENEVVKFILKNNEEIQDMSMSQIAKVTYTSDTILVRLAKKLGFDGWKDFKKAYLEEIAYLRKASVVDASIPFHVNDTFTNIADNIAQLEKDSIQDTLDLLSHDDLYGAMRLLRDVEVIDVYGSSRNILLAQEFEHKMQLIDQYVKVTELSSDARRQAAMSDKTHCAILISYSGESDFIINLARILKKKQVPMIAITSIGHNDLSQLSDVTLRLSSKEMLQSKIGDFASSQSIKLILDILYACIFSLDYQNNLENKIAIEKEIDKRYSGFEYING